MSSFSSRITKTTIAHYYILELKLLAPHIRCEISHTHKPYARTPCDLPALKSPTPILSCHQRNAFVRICVTLSQALPAYHLLRTHRLAYLGKHSFLLQHVVVIMAVSSRKIQHPREFCIFHEDIKGDVTQLTHQHMFHSNCFEEL